MCLAMPAKVLSIDGDEAEVDFGGAIRRTNVSMVDAKVGEYVIIHAGFAIQKVDEEEALETLQLWSEFLGGSEEA
ncbi:MAG TPA: HypC/HybG/HupF family hydrogenase formation chaperone [Methanomassiliicoccales archaeon]|nr:HypC/HybG/HupF family hydrogenase formation chaperone [Methanomassiliicoccales archaeon]HRU11411.1 HypC/HybG/HupF family hydrogenase formation chaperone [Methanomassiliicoccales archaeon]